MATNSNSSALIAATASRLRLVQIDLADHSPQERTQYISDEIARALKNVLPENRQQFLQELQACFPTWESDNAPAPATAQRQSAFDESQLNDASFLLERLKRLAPGLNETARRVIMQQLQSAGFEAPHAQDGWPREMADATAKKLQIKQTDPHRALDLLNMAYDTLTSLDQLVWQTWQMLAPQSAVKRPAPLKKTLGPFIGGDVNVPRGQITQDLDSLRQLIAALVSATGQAGKQFAAAHVARFAPAEIQAAVEMEKKGGFFTNKEVYYWRKYVELRRDMDQAAVEREITQAIAEFAERLMKGIKR